MKQDKRHTNNKLDPEALSDLFSSTSKIAWEKSKEEIWDQMEDRLMMDGKKGRPVRTVQLSRRWLGLTGALVLLLSIGTFLRLYTVKTFCPQGVHTTLQLPDGSGVELNASTHLSYHPYWWFISREVKLEGEAFFTVEKGRKFQVVSSSGITEVLGTSFNVFARGDDYIVTCHSGSVRVTESSGNEAVVLSPNQRSILGPAGGFTVTKLEQSLDSPAWTDNMIMFSATPLRLVFEEVERQFGIVIETPAEMQQVYSGRFTLDQTVDNILSLLCLPFDLEYEHKEGNTYRIYSSGGS